MSGSATEPGVGGLASDCRELATAVAIAGRAIAGGGHADLDALTERLRELLDAIAARPRAEQQELLPQLLALAEEIDELGGVVAAERKRCSDDLAKGEASARVIAAYTKTGLN
jgi:hypothetical protein